MIKSPLGSVRLPTATDDELISRQDDNWSASTTTMLSPIESFVQTIKLYSLLGLTLDRDDSYFVKPLGTETEIQKLLELDAALMEWKKALPVYLTNSPATAVLREATLSGISQNSPSNATFAIQASRLHAR
jgi:hypothetical protein